jgi:hypothetical protein
MEARQDSLRIVYSRTEGHWSQCAIRRSPIRVRRPWADLTVSWHGRHPRALLRNLVLAWVRASRAADNWAKVCAVALRALSARRGRHPARSPRNRRRFDPWAKWHRVILLAYAYKYNACLASFYNWPVLQRGWHAAGESHDMPFFLAVRHAPSGHLLFRHSRASLFNAAAGLAGASDYCPGTLELLTTWVLPGPAAPHASTHPLVRPIHGFDFHNLHWQL